MRSLPDRNLWPAALGMTALVLGHVALIVFFMPVLGIPLAAFGLSVGTFGVLFASLQQGRGLRWGLAGLIVCGIALGMALTLHCTSSIAVWVGQPSRWNPPPGRVSTPPPASPAF